MRKIYKKHNSAFKSKVALEALKERKTLSELSSQYGIASTQISTWKKHLEEESCKLFDSKKDKNLQGEIDRLYRILGQVTAERDFLERALNRWT